MKRNSVLCLILIIALALSGCAKGRINKGKYGRKQVTEILRCFDERDIAGLKAMFCEKVASEHDLDSEIKDAMDLYNGKSISHDKVQFGGGELIYHGEIVDDHIGYLIENIETDKESNYCIATHSYIIYQDDPSCIGMTYLTLFDNNTNENIKIGEYVS